jgi:membrane dipeptidase
VTDAATLHDDAIVIDATCPPTFWYPRRAEWVAGGVTACALSVGGTAGLAASVGSLAETHRFLRETPGVRFADSIAGLRAAKEAGELAVYFHFQGAEPLEYDPSLVEIYHRLGVRILQLAYNRGNPLGDGCEEPRDAGLTTLGRRMIAELNRVGMVVDVSHTGVRTSLEAVEASSAPVIASHSNARAVHENRRNLPDDLIRAIADSGGVIGMNGFPSFVAPGARPTLDQLIDHMVYIDELVGPGHVALGIDYYDGGRADYDAMIATGVWMADNYGPPPYHYPAGIESPSGFPALTARLLERGYSEDGVRGILGENWLRVYETVWRQP